MILGWENSLGWLAFLSLIPFIILYIIRPKPKEIEIPSLMFFMKSKTHKTKHSFFQQLSKNLLFLLQLLIFILLSLLFIKPYTTLGSNLFSEHTILIIDTSASTQVHNNAVFENIIAEAKKHLSRTNTIILVSNTPRTGLKEATKRDAARYLNNLQPTDSRSSIGEAILLAEKYIQGDEDRVIVISDFLTTSVTDLALAKNTLMGKGISVQFIPFTAQQSLKNIGIVDIVVASTESTVTVKNYGSSAEKVTLLINKISTTLNLDAYGIATHTFMTPSQPTTLALQVTDDFAPDNTAYLTLPPERKIKVLLMSDDPSFYLQTALTAAPYVQLDIVGSGNFREGYDVYILGKLRELPESLLKKLEQRLNEGASIVVRAEDNSLTLDYGNLLPLQLQPLQGKSLITVEQLTQFTQDIAFGNVEKYYGTKNPQGIVLAKAKEDIILLLKPVSQGNLVYYGVLEDYTDFELNPSYPIFWANLIRYVAHVESIDDVNVPTGTILPLPTTKTVIMPRGTFTTDLIIFEDRGLYRVGDSVYAASLKSELELDTTLRETIVQETLADLTTSQEQFSYPLTTSLLILLSILFVVELLLTRLRGEF